MKSKIIIRKARKEDINQIFKLGEQIPELKFSKKHFHEKFELKQFTKGNDNIFLIAEFNKEILGFIYAKILTKDWCMLDNLVVDEKYREHGIGTILLNELYKILKKQKVSYVQILEEIHHKNTRNFWKDKGFKEEKVFVWADKILGPTKLNKLSNPNYRT